VADKATVRVPPPSMPRRVFSATSWPFFDFTARKMSARCGSVKRDVTETAWLSDESSLFLCATMNDTEQEILQTLIELDEAVKSLATANPKPELLPLFARLDELAGQLPPTTDSELLHFLQRKSYAKARARLEGRKAARGALRPLT
jgi:hypothetical protein